VGLNSGEKISVVDRQRFDANPTLDFDADPDPDPDLALRLFLGDNYQISCVHKGLHQDFKRIFHLKKIQLS
jgi:hypothetical protein